jgi:hypothetical protein
MDYQEALAEQIALTSSITLAYEQEKALANYARAMYQYEAKARSELEIQNQQILDYALSLEKSNDELSSNVCTYCLDWPWVIAVAGLTFFAGFAISR